MSLANSSSSKKKHGGGGGGINILVYHRRRSRQHHFHYCQHLVPFIWALGGAILFLVLSFLAPTPLPIITSHHHHLHINDHRHHHDDFNNISSSVNGGGGDVKEELRFDSDHKKSLFQVPKSGNSVGGIWSSKLSNFFYACSNASPHFPELVANRRQNRYLLIATSGGLNQQRTGITDAVVAAHILNTTLIVPKLDQKSFWKDTRNFSEIFNVDWFISSLSKDVKIIKQLPANRVKAATPYSMRVPRKCTKNCYLNRVLPVLDKKHVVQLSKFDYRLANKLDTDLQKLRCRVNYHALKFTDSILEMGNKLVGRMKLKTKHFIALHLRFESDMLAFSGCYYGGGDKERNELGAMRRRIRMITLILHTGKEPRKRTATWKMPADTG